MSGPSFALQEIFGVKDKVVLITGGGTGIGKAITAAFATNGAKVTITGRRLEVLQATAKELGGDISCIRGDVATKEGCKTLIDEFAKSNVRLDCLINCAGVSTRKRYDTHKHNDPDEVEKLLAAPEDEDWSFSNAVNNAGVYFTTSFAVPLLRKSDNPSVVNIASIAGMMNQRLQGSVIYGVTKSGTIHLSKLLAGRLSPMKIRVNCVCPGLFPSEMTGEAAAEGGQKYNMEHSSGKAAERSPMGRAGEPEEIAGPVLMLCSKAGMYMDGATVVVDGGRTMSAGIHDGLRIPEELYTFEDV